MLVVWGGVEHLFAHCISHIIVGDSTQYCSSFYVSGNGMSSKPMVSYLKLPINIHTLISLFKVIRMDASTDDEHLNPELQERGQLGRN